MKIINTLSKLRLHLGIAVLLSALLSTASTHLKAQSEDKLVYATMRTSQQFVGRVVSQNDEMIQLSLDGVNDTLSLRRSMIKNIGNAENKLLLKHGRFHKAGGQSYGLGFSSGETDDHTFSLVELIAYKNINQRVGLGGGVGIRYYKDWNWDYHNLSFGDLFTYGKLYLTNKRRRLFIDTKLGYAIALQTFDFAERGADEEEIIFRSEFSSGFMAQPGIGLEFATKKKLKWAVKINMVYQNTHIKRGPINQSQTISRRGVSNFVQSLDFPSLHLGFYI